MCEEGRTEMQAAESSMEKQWIGWSSSVRKRDMGRRCGYNHVRKSGLFAESRVVRAWCGIMWKAEWGG